MEPVLEPHVLRDALRSSIVFFPKVYGVVSPMDGWFSRHCTPSTISLRDGLRNGTAFYWLLLWILTFFWHFFFRVPGFFFGFVFFLNLTDPSVAFNATTR